jgi:hypothetical protein
MWALPGTLVIDGVLVIGWPTVHVVVIDPALTQLNTRGPMVPSKVCSEGHVGVHAEDPQNILLILVPIINVLPMVDIKFLHTSLIDMIEPVKL